MLGKETKTTVHKLGLETPSELLDLRVGEMRGACLR